MLCHTNSTGHTAIPVMTGNEHSVKTVLQENSFGEFQRQNHGSSEEFVMRTEIKVVSLRC